MDPNCFAAVRVFYLGVDMGYTMGPVRPQAQGTPVGMLPGGFMMGGGRQGRKIEPGDYKSLEDYRKAVEEEEARKEAFFGGIDKERQAMMPFWMR